MTVCCFLPSRFQAAIQTSLDGLGQWFCPATMIRLTRLGAPKAQLGLVHSSSRPTGCLSPPRPPRRGSDGQQNSRDNPGATMDGLAKASSRREGGESVGHALRPLLWSASAAARRYLPKRSAVTRPCCRPVRPPRRSGLGWREWHGRNNGEPRGCRRSAEWG